MRSRWFDDATFFPWMGKPIHIPGEHRQVADPPPPTVFVPFRFPNIDMIVATYEWVRLPDLFTGERDGYYRVRSWG